MSIEKYGNRLPTVVVVIRTTSLLAITKSSFMFADNSNALIYRSFSLADNLSESSFSLAENSYELTLTS